MDYIEISPTGEQKKTEVIIPGDVLHRALQEEIDKRLGASTSKGASWLREIRNKRSDTIKEVPFGEQKWYIKEFALESYDLLGCLMSLNGHSIVDLSDPQSKAIFTKCLLQVGVCSSQYDPTPMFPTLDLCSIWYETSGEAALIARILRAELIEVNYLYGTANEENGQKKTVVLTPTHFG